MSIDTLNAPRGRDTGAPAWMWGAGVGLALVAWVLAYSQLVPFSAWLVSLLPVDPQSRLGSALTFFFYDTPKVILLLTLVVFAMGVVRSYFSPEKTRALLAGKREGLGNVLAAGLGVLTPFCSCSAVPLFIGFVSAGVPLGVTFSFLIAAPMVNEVALGLLFALVGWPVALTYLAFGLALAIVAGWVIGRLKLEGWLQDWVKEIQAGAGLAVPQGRLSFVDRLKLGLEAVRDIVGRVWIWMIVGIAAGALIHGYVPAELMARIMGADAWWSVPAAVLVGIPMYSNAAGVIPIVEALLDKGAALGTTLAFMMSVIALSLPEMIILRKVLTLRLIAVFLAVVGGGILMVGYLFNLLFS
ncbi:permease [Xanthobacter sp. ZOL 2024]